MLGTDVGELAARARARASTYPGDAGATLTRVAQYVARHEGLGPAVRRAARAASQASAAPTPVHRFFASLPPLLRERGLPHQLIVTTSYDLALEQAFLEAGEEFDVVSYLASGRNRGKLLPPRARRRGDGDRRPEHVRDGALARAAHVILKLHGGVDPTPSASGRASSSPRTTTSTTSRRRTSSASIPVGLAAQAAAQPLPLPRLRDARLEPARSCSTGCGATSRSSYRSWAVQPEAKPLEREFWRAPRRRPARGAARATTSRRSAARGSSRGVAGVSADASPCEPVQGPRAVRGLASSTRCSSSAASASARSIVANLLAVAADRPLRRRAASARARCSRAGGRAAAARRSRRRRRCGDLVAASGDDGCRADARSTQERSPTCRTARTLPRPRPVRGVLPLPRRRDGPGSLRTSCPSCSGARAARERPARDPRGRARAARRLQGADPERVREPPAARPPRPRGRRAPRSSARSTRWNELAPAERAVEIEPGSSTPCSTRSRPAASSSARRARRRRARADEPGGSRRRILQLVLERLWEAERERGSRTLRLETLRELGGADAIVRDHLERALGAARRRSRTLAAAMFDHLVTPSGTKIAHASATSPTTRASTQDELEPVLGALGRERILRPVEDGGGERPRYEIFHDVLADAVLAWRAERRVERERQAAAAPAPPAARCRGPCVARARWRSSRRSPSSRSPSATAPRGTSAQATAREREANALRQRARARELEANALFGLPTGDDASLPRALEAARLEPGPRSEAVLRQTLLESRLRVTLPAAGRVSSLQFQAGRTACSSRAASRSCSSSTSEPAGSSAGFADRARRHGGGLGRGGLCSPATSTVARSCGIRLGAPSLRRVRGRGAVTSSRSRRRTLRAGHDGRRRRRGGSHRRRSSSASCRSRARCTRVSSTPAGSLVATIARIEAGRVRGRVSSTSTSGRLLTSLPQLGVQDVEFSPDGSLLATGSHDGTVGLWEPRTGDRVQALYDDGSNVKDIAFSPTGTLLASAGGDGGPRVWTVATADAPVLLPGPHVRGRGGRRGAPTAAFSPMQAATAPRASTRSRAWPRPAAARHRCPGTTAGTTALAFDPTGARLATGAATAASGSGTRVPRSSSCRSGVDRRPVYTASYSPDGRLVVSAGGDGTRASGASEARARCTHCACAGPVTTRASAPTASWS